MGIYAIEGEGIQQVGGDCPNGWIAMKSERPGGSHVAAKDGSWVEKTLSRDEIESSRLRAYADPITGSDRFFAEAARLLAMGAGADEIEAAKVAGANRYAEIQAQFPWPPA